MSEYRITVQYDPTCPRGMRWGGKVHTTRGEYVTSISLAISRKSVERQIRRYLARCPHRQTYTYELEGN